MNTFTLKQARVYRYKTQQDMASLLDVHLETYRKLEENQEKITIQQAKLICSYLDVPYDLIFFTD